MRQNAVLLGTVIAISAGANAAGGFGLHGNATPGVPAAGPVTLPQTQELAWDNGTWRYLVWWDQGEDSWVGNDFDLPFAAAGATRIVSIRLFSSDQHPNDTWEGFNVAIFQFTPGTPGHVGDRLWPAPEGDLTPFIPTGVHGETVWVTVPVDWVTSERYVVAAMEQIHDDPICDPFAVDNNAAFRGHSWMSYDELPWRPLSTLANPFRNLMLRLVVEEGGGMYQARTPTSWGRAKAMFR
jgi:hypothetical protein